MANSMTWLVDSQNNNNYIGKGKETIRKISSVIVCANISAGKLFLNIESSDDVTNNVRGLS